jgi:hypothetical protein
LARRPCFALDLANLADLDLAFGPCLALDALRTLGGLLALGALGPVGTLGSLWPVGTVRAIRALGTAGAAVGAVAVTIAVLRRGNSRSRYTCKKRDEKKSSHDRIL